MTYAISQELVPPSLVSNGSFIYKPNKTKLLFTVPVQLQSAFRGCLMGWLPFIPGTGTCNQEEIKNIGCSQRLLVLRSLPPLLCIAFNEGKDISSTPYSKV